MGKGRELGTQLRAWLEGGGQHPLHARLLEGMLLDALGSEEPRLRGPLRDLALQPLLLTLLQERSPAVRRSMLDTLGQDLRATYAAPVLAELLDLLEAATGLAAGPRPAQAPAPSTARSASRSGRRSLPVRTLQLLRELHPLAPALALGFANALVLQWLGDELARRLPQGWGGALLLLVLAVLQLLMLRPLARLRRDAPLTLAASADPHRLWRWITAPWVHHRQSEALLNAVMWLILLGGTPLPLGSLLLRYLLTSLATMAVSVLLARRWLRAATWDGATGAVAALISLSAGVSLLHWRPVSFPFALLSVPAWVLFLVYGAIQMAWVLPRQVREETASPLQRLLCSCWWWGTAAGFGWAVLIWLLAWAGPLLRGAGRG
ncbi:MAG: rhomboid family intramembrane serine protease [Cyanobium sp.]